MNNIQKRFILFLFGCMLVRGFLILLAKYSVNKYHTIFSTLGIFSIIIGIGFLTIYITNIRKTGPEVFGEKIWWNNIRPLHGILYLLFGLISLFGSQSLKEKAWIILLIDFILGLFSFLFYHYKQGNFSKIDFSYYTIIDNK